MHTAVRAAGSPAEPTLSRAQGHSLSRTQCRISAAAGQGSEAVSRAGRICPSVSPLPAEHIYPSQGWPQEVPLP